MQEMLEENGTETSVDRYDPSPDYYNIVAVKVFSIISIIYLFFHLIITYFFLLFI
jgi:hypothetical protein